MTDEADLNRKIQTVMDLKIRQLAGQVKTMPRHERRALLSRLRKENEKLNKQRGEMFARAGVKQL